MPDKQPVTGFAVEACSRRIAQLASPYRVTGITSRATGEATVIDRNRYSIVMMVSIDYGREVKTAQIHCLVTQGGRVETVEGTI